MISAHGDYEEAVGIGAHRIIDLAGLAESRRSVIDLLDHALEIFAHFIELVR